MRLEISLCALVSLCGCTADPAQLVVVVRSDMHVPEELTSVLVELLESEQAISIPISLEGEGSATLPFSFGVAPRDSIDRPVHLRVTALLGETERFQTEVRTGFVSRQILRLDIFLARRCLDRTCEPGTTCRLDGCEPIDVPPETLPVHIPDAGFLDAGSAGADAGPCSPGRGPLMVTPLSGAGVPTSCTVGADGCGMDQDCQADYNPGTAGVCRPRCGGDSDCASLSGSGSLCDPRGHCTVPCDPVNNTGCPDGRVCGLGVEYLGPDGCFAAPHLYTVCRTETVNVSRGCDDEASAGQGDCESRQYCSSGRCRKLCFENMDCSSGDTGRYCCTLTGAAGGIDVNGSALGRCGMRGCL